MLPVLGPAAVREADAWTIGHEPISSLALMERASTRCVQRVIGLLDNEGCLGAPFGTGFLVVAGMGNNGGDGLAVARLLHQGGMRVRVVRVRHRTAASEDNEMNLGRALACGVEVNEVAEGGEFPSAAPDEVIIDALFGTGLQQGIGGWVGGVVEHLNASGRPIVAIDMPSGLFAEPVEGVAPGAVVRAHRTLTFEVPKLAFFFAENASYVGRWEVLPIGLDAAFVRSRPASFHLLQEQDVTGLLRPRPRFGHKGTFGHALLIGGSTGRMGAAVLMTRSALRSGAGLVTVRVPGPSLDILQAAAPEAMCSIDPAAEDGIGTLPDLGPFRAVGIGPGLGTSDGASLLLKNLIRSAGTSCVIDADGLNILAENPTLLAFLPQGTVLTPHPREFDRLAGVESETGHERLRRARELSVKWRCHLVLKGAWTAICDPSGHVLFNPTGNPGMAKGGSGDALTGLLTGLLAQGHGPKEACILGVYLHGLAGDIAAEKHGMDGMTANDLVEAIPAAWRRLRKASGSEQVVG